MRRKQKINLGRCNERDVYIEFGTNGYWCWITTQDDDCDDDEVVDSVQLSPSNGRGVIEGAADLFALRQKPENVLCAFRQRSKRDRGSASGCEW